MRFDYGKLHNGNYAVFACHLKGRLVELIQFNTLASAAHTVMELNRTYRDHVKNQRMEANSSQEPQYRWHIKVGNNVQEQEALMIDGYEPWAILEETIFFKKRVRVK
jgi:hypothetical protein